MPRSDRIPASEITPPELYFNRRKLLKVGAAAASLVVTGAAYRRLNRTGSSSVDAQRLARLSVSAGEGRGCRSGVTYRRSNVDA